MHRLVSNLILRNILASHMSFLCTSIIYFSYKDGGPIARHDALPDPVHKAAASHALTTSSDF